MYEYGCTKANSETEERLVVELVYLECPQAVSKNRAERPATSLSFIMINVILSQIYIINSFLSTTDKKDTLDTLQIFLYI